MSKKTKILVQKVMNVSEKIKDRICVANDLASGLTMAQIRALQVLAHQEKLTMAQIAEHLKIKPASATSLVNKMVEQGWLIREDDENDRRKVWIRISDEKQSEWKKQESEQLERLSEFMDVLNEEQKETFISILDILLKR